MNNDDTSSPDAGGVSRRSTLILAAGVAALGVALGMRSNNAYAQAKGAQAASSTRRRRSAAPMS